MPSPDVLVVGAGLGGIATAARLARKGYRVTVVEKGGEAGGRCGRLARDGHQFDVGATLFLMPQIYAQTFADLGEHMEDHLELRRIDPTYQLYFDDGLRLALTSQPGRLREQLEAVEPGSYDGLLRYLREARRNYELSISRVAGRRYRRLSEYVTPRNLLLFLRLGGLAKHYDNAGRYFDDDRLKAAFTFQDMYMSLSPYEAPATFSLLQYTELVHGVWLPMGGMYRVVEALSDIAKAGGVRFRFDAEVSRIDVDGRHVKGITLASGQQMRADIVVANADLPYVYSHLLADEAAADRLLGMEYTCSAVVFFWGVDRQYPELGVHNLFFVSDYRRSLEAILKTHTLPEQPILYVHAPARIDPTRAPEGADSMTVVVPVGHIDEAAHQDWTAVRDRARACVFDRLAAIGVADLRRHIKFEVCWTPCDWRRRFNLIKGATHGLGHGLRQMGYLRPGNRHDRYTNLYFVGASTHPGTGLPSVLMSARHVSERILEEGAGAQT